VREVDDTAQVHLLVDRAAAPLDMNGRPVRLGGLGIFLVFDGLKPGDAVGLGFPVPQSTERYTVSANSPAETVYTCTFRRSTCVEVGPRDDGVHRAVRTGARGQRLAGYPGGSWNGD
jgi:hypothetical protein